MARRPNYRFERQERDRLKAKKAADKRAQREGARAQPDEPTTDANEGADASPPESDA